METTFAASMTQEPLKKERERERERFTLMKSPLISCSPRNLGAKISSRAGIYFYSISLPLGPLLILHRITNGGQVSSLSTRHSDSWKYEKGSDEVMVQSERVHFLLHKLNVHMQRPKAKKKLNHQRPHFELYFNWFSHVSLSLTFSTLLSSSFSLIEKITQHKCRCNGRCTSAIQLPYDQANWHFFSFLSGGDADLDARHSEFCLLVHFKIVSIAQKASDSTENVIT